MKREEPVCSKCKDTGWKPVTRGDDRKFVVRCQCQANDIFLTRSDLANIPPRFQGFDLRGYLPQESNPSQKKAVKTARDFIDDFPAVKDEKGLLFQGPVGVGKTRLICSIANELLKRIPTLDVYYIDWNDLVKELRSGEDHSSRDFGEIEKLMSRLIEVDILFFDELGATRLSEWAQNKVYHLINKRYNYKKLTVCATNFQDNSVNNRETLTQRVGDRIRSRLYEMTDASEIKGSDYRRTYG